MKIAIIGTGYVGLVTGACLASLGHEVICVDKDFEKIAKLKNHEPPFFEPGLEDLLKSENLSFDLDFDKAEIVMCCVGTPCNKKGEVDLTAVNNVIKKHANKGEFFVMKSTVPLGTCAKIDHPKVIMNPEFLR
ncbi:UDP-glucose 6-dehydrogenase, partial [Patescibacteria group bacterium]